MKSAGMHPRLADPRSAFIHHYAGAFLMASALVLLLLAYAVFPWDPTTSLPSPTEWWLRRWFALSAPSAALLAVLAFAWAVAVPHHGQRAAALAFISGHLLWLNSALYALWGAMPFGTAGFLLEFLAGWLLLLPVLFPRSQPDRQLPHSRLSNPIQRKIYLQGYVISLASITFLLWLLPLFAEKPLHRLVHSGVLGIFEGSLYALIALGIIIINKATGVFNFSHGAMMLFGGMILFSFFQSTSIHPIVAVSYSIIVVTTVLYSSGSWRESKRILLAMIAVLLLSGLLVVGGASWWLLHGLVGTLMGALLLAFFIDRVAIRPLLGQPIFAVVMATIAMEIILRGIVRVLWGSQVVTIPLFYFVKKPTITFPIGGGRVFLFTSEMIGMFIAMLAYLAFILFFRYSKIGLSMRAAAENPRLAQSLGLQVRILLSFTWGIAAIFAALAGSLIGASKGIASEITPALALKAFPAVLLGGLESIPGALVGGLIIGLAEQYSVLLFSTDVATQLVPFALLMIVLIIRPQGLFGQKRIERI